MTLSVFTLENELGMRVQIMNFGARIISIKLPVDQELVEMTVAPANPRELLHDPFYIGATCGPVCNRIRNARFILDGRQYYLSKNDGENCLHGGTNNISYKFWEVLEVTSKQLVLSLELAHLSDGFPGNRKLQATYTLSQNNRLNITYEAWTDLPTPINMTNHTYFNLGEKDIKKLEVKLFSSQFLEKDRGGLPTGKLLSTQLLGVSNGSWQNIENLIYGNSYRQVIEEQGLDHCLITQSLVQNKLIAKLRTIENCIELSVYSNKEACQLYTGRHLDIPYAPYQGMCFESQSYTDAVNQSSFPNIICNPNNNYSHKVSFEFNMKI